MLLQNLFLIKRGLAIMIGLIVERNTVQYRFKFQSVEEAAREALYQLRHNKVQPVAILDDDRLIWKASNSKTIKEELKKLAVGKD